MGSGLLIRLLAVGTFAAGAPVALNTAPSTPAIFTGDANASGPGIGGENTGGNVQGGTGRSESKTVTGNPAAAPSAPAIPPVVARANPAADAVARARAQVDAARARAQAAIDAARAQAEQAAADARQRADEAQARSRQQNEEARARAEANSAAAHSSYTDED